MPSTENAIRLPEQRSGVFNRRGRRIADELEAQVEEKTMFGQLPPSVNRNLAAYDESVTLPGVFADLRGSTADIKPETPKPEPKTPDITVTSPNTGNIPTNWAQYEEFLNNKLGIKLSGFESNDLPGGVEGSTSTPSAPSVSQAGASGEADITDQTRQLEVDQTKNRALPRGARQREMFLRQNPGYGRPEAPKPEKGGLSARSKAFLAYDGKFGS